MKDIYVFAFSKNGYLLSETISRFTDCYICIKTKSDLDVNKESKNIIVFDENLSVSDFLITIFDKAKAIIFISSAGLAVRLIAPYIKHKSKDPAVVVIDELGRFCIPILSGHLGGANEIALQLANKLSATPVITTASDINGLTAIDIFAKNNGLYITDFEKAKTITASLLAGKKIYVVNDANINIRQYPDEYVVLSSIGDYEGSENLVVISYAESINSDGLILIPKCINIGLGCRKGTDKEKIIRAISNSLSCNDISIHAVKSVHSIDLKSNEAGIIQACLELDFTFITHSAKELKSIKGDFTKSEFVNEITGVDNVCERSAVCDGYRLIVKKEVYDGVTIAISLEE